MTERLRMVYAGTPEFAVPALRCLLNGDHRVVAVYTQPDRPAGRGRKLQASPVKRLAQEFDCAVEQPTSLKPAEAQDRLAAYRPDLMVVAAYGLILPQAVLDIPTHGCWNIHASLLPRWRGAAPIQRAIIAGDGETGITTMQMDAGLDTGDILNALPTPIHRQDTAATLHDRLSELGAMALSQCLDELIENGEMTGVPQNPDQACYAAKLSKQEAAIDWLEPGYSIERKIRAFNPWPVSWTEWHGERIRIWSADFLDRQHDTVPGRWLPSESGHLDVACGEGMLRVKTLQREGGRPISAREYLNARLSRQA